MWYRSFFSFVFLSTQEPSGSHRSMQSRIRATFLIADPCGSGSENLDSRPNNPVPGLFQLAQVVPLLVRGEDERLFVQVAVVQVVVRVHVAEHVVEHGHQDHLLIGKTSW